MKRRPRSPRWTRAPAWVPLAWSLCLTSGTRRAAIHRHTDRRRKHFHHRGRHRQPSAATFQLRCTSSVCRSSRRRPKFSTRTASTSSSKPCRASWTRIASTSLAARTASSKSSRSNRHRRVCLLENAPASTTAQSAVKTPSNRLRMTTRRTCLFPMRQLCRLPRMKRTRWACARRWWSSTATRPKKKPRSHRRWASRAGSWRRWV